jgi:hypothetical protein
VCEDLARLHTFVPALHGHGVSLVLVPVFARPTKDRRWERARAEVYCDAIGSTVVVANSLVIAEILRAPAPVGTAIAIAAITGFYGEIDSYLGIKHGIVVDWLLISLWLGALWTLVRAGRERRAYMWPGVVVLAAYLLFTAFEVLLAGDLSAALRSYRSSYWYAAAFLLLAYAPLAPEAHVRIARGMVLVAAGVGAFATLRWQIGPSHAELTHAVRADYTNLVNGEVGTFGSFHGRHELAAWTALMIPFCAIYALAMRDAWRLVAAAALVLCSIGLLATNVRAGLVAAVAGVVLVLALYSATRGLPGLKLGTSAMAALAAAILGVGVFAVTTGGDQQATARFENILTPTQDPAVQARFFKWRTAIDDIDRRPFGYGLGSAGLAQEREGRFLNVASYSLDNGYLKIAYEQGFFIAVLFGLALLTLFAGLLLRALAAPDGVSATLAIAGCGALASLMVLMVAGAFQEGLPALAAWMVVGLGVARTATAPAAVPEAEPKLAGARAAPEPTG